MLRRFNRWWRNNKDIAVQLLMMAIWVVIVVATICLFVAGLMAWSALAGVLIAFVVAGLAMVRYLFEKKEQMLLLGFTSKYLIEKDESRLDDLLGILIAGRWKRLRIDPVEEFFGSVKGLCFRGDYEARRRVAEALPALFKLDLEESKDLVEILRHDWDEEKWRSDNRRRVIEALSHILKKEKRLVRNNLKLVDKDEIYTVIAIVELMDAWREQINKREGEQLFNALVEDLKERRHSEDEISAMVEFWDFLNLTRYNMNLAFERFETLKLTSNAYLQICLARNLKRLCRGYPRCKDKRWCTGNPERILDLMAFFLQGDKKKNVRRPIDREEMLECLFTLLRYKRYSMKAKEIVWTLANDKDDIIRVGTFDRIENIMEIDPAFGIQILEHVIATIEFCISNAKVSLSTANQKHRCRTTTNPASGEVCA